MTPLVEPIAIIGLGCRFPGAPDPAAYWRLLCDAGDAISEVPAERWDLAQLYDPRPTMPGKMSTRWGGFLPGVDRFDRGFFRISAREAAVMDPQQRLLLEVAWEALEDAGQAVDRLAGTPVSVFVGISSVDYGLTQFRTMGADDPYTSTGSALSIAANRISYLLDFRGPSLAIDTACSSSLVALHMACTSLRGGESNLALVGGVNVILSPEPTIAFSKGGLMAADGRCKAFDARADGYVRGEGVGVVVLKSLARAVAEGDPIRAVIRGSAVNQDGRSNGLTAPSRWAQEAVLREAYRQAGVVPSAVAFVEAHGTGTPLGDPIEVSALAAVMAVDRPADQPLAIGSAKSNIGHLEAAAGVAGLIKVVLALQQRAIPPSLHLSQPSPHIAWNEMPIRVQVALTALPERDEPVVAGLSSFGFGGTNAHVVLEEAPPCSTPPASAPDARTRLLPISAREPAALRALVAAYCTHLEHTPTVSLQDLCFTASVRRAHHAHRVAVVARSTAELRDGLEAFVGGRGDERVFTSDQPATRRTRLAFVFSGQGGQWVGMGQQLLAHEPAFRDAFEACAAALGHATGSSILDRLAGGDALEDVELLQQALFAIQVALVALWRAHGVEPDALIGHSVGEVAAAHVAGSLTLADAARIVAARARLVSRPEARGGMLAVELSRSDTERMLDGLAGRVAVAACNSPRVTVLSGDNAAIDALAQELGTRQIHFQRVRVATAYHGPWLEPLANTLAHELADLAPSSPRVPLYSSSLPGRVGADRRLDCAFWAHNMCRTVLFSTALEDMIADGCTAFVEVGPHPTLLRAIRDTALGVNQPVVALASARRGADARQTLLESLAALYTAGYPVAWHRRASEAGRCVPLPAYPWQRERCWSEAAAGHRSDTREPDSSVWQRHLQLAAHPGTRVWETELGPGRSPLLADGLSMPRARCGLTRHLHQPTT
ncbi:MAG: type I polyketide synthase [Chloroflexi bacterium]|nr:type I polyketide synthase [Chloroflexota bacterium]